MCQWQSLAVTGLATSATKDTTDASNISVGTLGAARLPISGVAAGTYGNATTQSQLTIDGYGRVTSVANVAVAIPSTAVSGLAASATTNACNAANITSGTLLAARLPTSGVTAKVYGGAAVVPVATVDTYGRLTSMANVNIAIASGAVSGLAASATTNTTDAANITAGILATARGGTGAGSLAANSLLVGNGTGTVLQPSNLTWDNSSSRLKVSTGNNKGVQVVSSDTGAGPAEVYFDKTANGATQTASVGIGAGNFYVTVNGIDGINVDTAGRVGLGNTRPQHA